MGLPRIKTELQNGAAVLGRPRETNPSGGLPARPRSCSLLTTAGTRAGMTQVSADGRRGAEVLRVQGDMIRP